MGELKGSLAGLGVNLRVKVTLREEVLGMMPNDQDIMKSYIASKSPDAESIDEEVASIGVDAAVDSRTTVFPRMEKDGQMVPFMYDYQWKGYFKDCCSALRRVDGAKSAKLSAFKKIIDGVIFVEERKIPIDLHGAQIGRCERPLRCSTPQGERISIAASESAPEGSTMEFNIIILDKSYVPYVIEWLDYGMLRGTGQWRSSGKGRFTYEILPDSSAVKYAGKSTSLEEIGATGTEGDEPAPAPKKRGRKPKSETTTEGQSSLDI